MTDYNINDQLTLYHRSKLIKDGAVVKFIDVMDKVGVRNFVKLFPMVEGNNGLMHNVTRTTSTPSPTRRTPYTGVPPTGSDHQKITEDSVYFEDKSTVDILELAGLRSDDEKIRFREAKDRPHMTGMLNQFVNSIFNDAKSSGALYLNGLKSRMATISNPFAGTGNLPYCYDNGGTTTGYMMSCYIMELGEDACHGFYPRGEFTQGAELGIIMDTNPYRSQDGICRCTDGSNRSYQGLETLFKMWLGFCVANDWKVARIANIDKAKTAEKGLDEDILIECLNHGKFDRTRTIIVGNPFLQTQLDIRAKNKLFAMENKMVFGQPMKAFQGDIPLVFIDATILTVTEPTVTT